MHARHDADIVCNTLCIGKFIKDCLNVKEEKICVYYTLYLD